MTEMLARIDLARSQLDLWLKRLLANTVYLAFIRFAMDLDEISIALQVYERLIASHTTAQPYLIHAKIREKCRMPNLGASEQISQSFLPIPTNP